MSILNDGDGISRGGAMGASIIQKIVARAAGQPSVRPGEFLNVRHDLVVMCEMYFAHVMSFFKEMGVQRLYDPNRVVAVIDHSTHLAVAPILKDVHTAMRQYFAEQGVTHFYDLGRGGLRQQIIVEDRHVRPGHLIFSDEPNIATAGVVGALNFPVGWNIKIPLAFGEYWLRVPGTIRITLEGRFSPGVYARDLAQKVAGDIRQDGAIWQAIVYDGPALQEIGLDSRMNLLALAYLAGAETAVIEPDDFALSLVEPEEREPFAALHSDPGAVDLDRRAYDVSRLAPQVTVPPECDAAQDVETLDGLPVDQACIGSCASGRIEDLREAARVLKGQKVHPRVRMFVTPISQKVYQQAAREGLLDVFIDAHVQVLAPGCNTCWGYVGQLADGERCISTHTTNYHGRMGSTAAEIYLANAATVAASAVTGKITDPRKFLA